MFLRKIGLGSILTLSCLGRGFGWSFEAEGPGDGMVPPRPPPALTRCLERMRHRDWSGALGFLREHIAEDGATPRLTHVLTEVENLATIEAVLARHPGWSRRLDFARACHYHNLLLFLRSHDGKLDDPFFEEARRAYERVLEADPRDSDARICLAGLYREAGLDLQAMSLYAGVNETFVTDHPGMLYVAYYYAASGEFDLALRWLGEASRLDPETTRDWVRSSNDFDRLRDAPGLAGVLAGDRDLVPRRGTGPAPQGLR